MTESPALSELIRKWEEQYRDDWALCYPKQYQVSGAYASPKQLALNLIEFRAPQRKNPRYSLGKEGLALISAAGLVDLRVPIFFVAADLLTAVRMSVPPGDLDWVNLHLPFDSAAFALSKGSLLHASRGEEL